MLLKTFLVLRSVSFYLCCDTELLLLAEGDPEEDDLLGAGAALEETDDELQGMPSRCASLLFEVCALQAALTGTTCACPFVVPL